MPPDVVSRVVAGLQLRTGTRAGHSAWFESPGTESYMRSGTARSSRERPARRCSKSGYTEASATGGQTAARCGSHRGQSFHTKNETAWCNLVRNDNWYGTPNSGSPQHPPALYQYNT